MEPPHFPSKKHLIYAVFIVVITIAIGLLIYLLRIQPSIKISEKNSVKTTSEPVSKTLYHCPAADSFCKNAKSVIIDHPTGKIYFGLGGEVASGSSIIAAFDGTLIGIKVPKSSTNPESYMTAILYSKELGLQAEYYFKGTIVDKEKVKKGEVIATASGEISPSLYNKSLIFQLMKLNQDKGGNMVQLSASDFIIN